MKTRPDRIVTELEFHICKNPCYPTYSVLCVYPDGRELQDCDCASSSMARVLEFFEEAYGDTELIMWDDPRHYSNCTLRYA